MSIIRKETTVEIGKVLTKKNLEALAVQLPESVRAVFDSREFRHQIHFDFSLGEIKYNREEESSIELICQGGGKNLFSIFYFIAPNGYLTHGFEISQYGTFYQGKIESDRDWLIFLPAPDDLTEHLGFLQTAIIMHWCKLLFQRPKS